MSEDCPNCYYSDEETELTPPVSEEIESESEESEEEYEESSEESEEVIPKITTGYDAMQYILSIGANISKGEEENVIGQVQNLSLSTLNQQDFDYLLVIFLNACAKYRKEELYSTLLQYWQSYETRPYSTSTSLFFSKIISSDALLMLREISDNNAAYYLAEIIKGPSSPAAADAAELILNVFGEQTAAVYEALHDSTIDQEIEEGQCNNVLREVAINHYEDVAPLAKKPKWVKDFNVVLAENPEVEHKLPSPEEAAILLTQGLTESSITESAIQNTNIIPEHLREFREKLTNTYSSMSNEERKELFKKLFLSWDREVMQDDITLFRLYGPVNPLFGIDLSEEDPCSIYGGCRMFTCVDYVNQEESDLNYEDAVTEYQSADWFTGSCNNCLHRIAAKHYSVRRPLETGGWIGCYCSIQCAKEACSVQEILQVYLLKIFKKQLNKYGIQERPADSPII